VTGVSRPGGLSPEERTARAVIGMPARHPELITRKPGRVEWQQLAALCSELWPYDEYMAIVTVHYQRRPPRF